MPTCLSWNSTLGDSSGQDQPKCRSSRKTTVFSFKSRWNVGDFHCEGLVPKVSWSQENYKWCMRDIVACGSLPLKVQIWHPAGLSTIFRCICGGCENMTQSNVTKARRRLRCNPFGSIQLDAQEGLPQSECTWEFVLGSARSLTVLRLRSYLLQVVMSKTVFPLTSSC